LSGKAAICLCLAADTVDADLRLYESCRGRVDMVEVRVDHLAAAERRHAARVPSLVGVPAILTVRRPSDGGAFDGDERERVALLSSLAGGGFRYVDLEDDLDAEDLQRTVAAAGARVVRSFHDFTGVPADLAGRLARLAHGPGEIPKAAVMPRSCADLARLLRALRTASPGQSVVLGMGEIGMPTRVLAPVLGSAWCYASPPGQSVAPGQIDPQTLEEVYRYRALGPETSVFGVIGSPIMHSRSPHIHNSGYSASGLDAVYLPFLVPDLEGFWEVADLLGIRGLSVTVPYKEGVRARVARADPTVEATGACNTISRHSVPGPWTGTNTDVEGFLAPLSEAFGGKVPRGLRVTVIGAGGAARSVIHALTTSGARVLILNRTPAKALALTREFGGECAGLDQEGAGVSRGFSDLIVQTTSVGMSPDPSDPAPRLAFDGHELVYDLVYAPPVTPFLRRALAAGCRTIPGIRMLIAQAMRQFGLFTGVPYPAELRSAYERQSD